MSKDLSPARGKKFDLLLTVADAELGQKWVLFFSVAVHFICAVCKVVKMTVLTLVSD